MDPFLGEIRAVAFPFAPRGWAVCDGSLQQIRQSTALFSLLGTTYGGDGRTTFGLPDLRGRAIVNAGQGPGLSAYQIGQQTGAESVTLNLTQMPTHAHGLSGKFTVSGLGGSTNSPTGNYLAGTDNPQYADSPAVMMAGGSVSGSGAAVGGNLAHPNLQPYLAVYYIIAMQGVFPQRP